ncbi:MAG: hypothetical protein RIS70_4071 [Planctomycetota bacterium]
MVLIMIAAACGLVASIGISQVMDPGTANQIETVKIYVAMTAIDIGTKLNENNVRLEAWPKDRLPQGAIGKFEDLANKYPRQRFFPDEPILMQKIGDQAGTNTDKIPEGYRVIPIKVASEGTAIELLAPGDRIDVLAFFRKNNDVRITGCKTILRNVRVYSVGNATERITDEKGVTRAALTVSLLVTPKQSQKVLMAAELGRLQFTLRNQTEGIETDDNEDIDFLEFLASPSENASEDTSPSGGAKPTSEIANGEQDSENTNKTTAAKPQNRKERFADWLKTQMESDQGNVELTPLQGTQNANPEWTWETVVFGPETIEGYSWTDDKTLPQRGTPRSLGFTIPAKDRPTVVAKPTLIVRQSLEVTGNLVTGGTIDWTAYRGKPTLLVLWQSDSPGCSTELELVKELLGHYEQGEIHVIGINMDADLGATQSAMIAHGIEWATLVGEDNLIWAAKHGITEVPTLLLVDREGRLLSKAHHVVDIAAQVEIATRTDETPPQGDRWYDVKKTPTDSATESEAAKGSEEPAKLPTEPTKAIDETTELPTAEPGPVTDKGNSTGSGK